MPTKHDTRSGIADTVPGIEYESRIDDGTMFVAETREREFTKAELVTVYGHLCDGHNIKRAPIESIHKRAVRDAVRSLMDTLGYNGFDENKRDGNPLRARELLTVLTGVRDAAENLRWEASDGD